MAIRRISILGPNTIPDNSGNVFFERYSIKATNDVWQYLVGIFKDTSTRIGLRGMFKIPKNFIGSPKIIVNWTSTAITGNTRWEFDYRAVGGNDTESLDQAGTQESVGVTDAAPGAVNRKLECEMALTAANLAVDDIVQFEFFRDGADAADTMAAVAILHSLEFEYSDA